MSDSRCVPSLDGLAAERTSAAVQGDIPPTATKAPLSRATAWVVDKIIEIAARRRYRTLTMKFAAGMPVQVSFEERFKIDELPAASDAALQLIVAETQAGHLEGIERTK